VKSFGYIADVRVSGAELPFGVVASIELSVVAILISSAVVAVNDAVLRKKK
jgi:hypothetical protein